jgi:hypothetical protein
MKTAEWYYNWYREAAEEERQYDGPPDDTCEWCEQSVYNGCSDNCECPDCENNRALDNDADAYFDRCRD